MHKLQKLLPYALSALAFAVAGLLYVENRRLNSQLVELMSRQARDGKKTSDPYLAGPVKNRILKGYGEIKACYKAYLASNPAQKSGKLRVDWQIATSGRPVSPEVVLSDFGNSMFEKCVTAKIAEWRFPEPNVQKYVEHTFRFDEKGEKGKAPPE
ncbi:MAG: hypothetical protein OHK0011_25390 [Turneriella sp.]